MQIVIMMLNFYAIMFKLFMFAGGWAYLLTHLILWGTLLMFGGNFEQFLTGDIIRFIIYKIPFIPMGLRFITNVVRKNTGDRSFSTTKFLITLGRNTKKIQKEN